MCFFDSSTQNYAEPEWNYLKNSDMDPNCVKFVEKVDFGHVQSYSWLHKWGWGNPQAGSGGTLEGGGQSQPFKRLYKNSLEIPKGIPS